MMRLKDASLSNEEERIAQKIVSAAFAVHKTLGPGLLISYLKLTNKRLGFLINFNVPLIKQGIKRVVI